MKLAINTIEGFFDLSHEAIMLFAKLRKFKIYPELMDDGDGFFYYFSQKKENRKITDVTFAPYDIERDDQSLVLAIENLGEKANTQHSQLKIIDIPDGVDWVVDDNNGKEWVEIILKIS